MSRPLFTFVVLLSLFVASVFLVGGTAAAQRYLGHQTEALTWDSSQRTVRGRSSFTLQYAFFHDEEESQRPPSFIHTSSLLQKSCRHIGSSDIIRPRPFTVVTRPWAENDEEARAHSGRPSQPLVPDVADRDTIINLAMMTSDAYIFGPSEPDWMNSTNGFNHSTSFGWDGVGLRGHIFSNANNETVIISFKGTSPDPRDEGRANDRLNDNLLFSCCCADQRPDPYPYGPVCGCRTGTFQCKSTCLTQEVCQTDRYYVSALAVVDQVLKLYPESIVWSIGHSLGGAIASLVGLTYDLPAVTFETPPEKLPAHRLGLLSPREPPTWHFGNTADPIFMGACNGWSSSCALAGYAFESQCFTGKRCVYDTVNDMGWRMSIANHRINTVIQEVLLKYNTTPTCEFDDECVDCYNWNFTLSNDPPSGL